MCSSDLRFRSGFDQNAVTSGVTLGVTSGGYSLTETQNLTPLQSRALESLIHDVTDFDGVHPLSEHVWLHLKDGGDTGARHFLVHENDHQIVGYAHLDSTDLVAGPSGELAVQPEYRRQGIGRLLMARLLDVSHDSLRLWSHGEHPGAAALARSFGFTRARHLWQMRRSLYASMEDPEIPQHFDIRSFRPALDEPAWLEVNARSFAHLPDQGAWTLADLRLREQETWFDSDGFLLAWKKTGTSERLAGFHWTKIHGQRKHGHDAIGEVYVLGVDPDFRGTGLGRALTLLGLHHLRRRGLAQVMLYVDADNRTAVDLYDSLGFTQWDSDVMYQRSPLN